VGEDQTHSVPREGADGVRTGPSLMDSEELQLALEGAIHTLQVAEQALLSDMWEEVAITVASRLRRLATSIEKGVL
jgi:hypothetical protein